jgi:hypothetical protein
MLTLADGTFFPLVVGAIPWGRASGPAGLAPEALQERGCSCKVFSQDPLVCGVLVLRCHAHVSDTVYVRCAPGGVTVSRAPEPGPVRGDRGGLSD